MSRALLLTASLFGLWLVLSGMFSGLLLGLGVASSVWVMRIATRMDVADHEGYPMHLNVWRLLGYGRWLVVEVVKSNIDVVRHVWSRRLTISPVIVRVASSQRSKLGQVIFANSITLTPGTVSINLWRNEIRVHALTRDAAKTLRDGEMDARVSRLEGQ